MGRVSLCTSLYEDGTRQQSSPAPQHNSEHTGCCVDSNMVLSLSPTPALPAQRQENSPVSSETGPKLARPQFIHHVLPDRLGTGGSEREGTRC